MKKNINQAIQKIQLENKEISLEKCITFIIGEISENSLENFPYIWLKWEDILDRLFNSKNTTDIFNFIINTQKMNDYTLLNKNTIKNDSKPEKNPIQEELFFSPDWNSLWKKRFEQYRKLSKVNKVLNNINRLITIQEERTKIEVEISQLEYYKKILEKLNTQEHYLSKKDHLESLKIKKQKIQDSYDIIKDQYFTNKNQIEELQKSLKDLKEKLLSLKDQQRELFKNTNEITKAIDDIYPKLDNYQEKMDKYIEKSGEDSEDFIRVKKKHDELVPQITILKEKKEEYMKKSKSIKKTILHLNTLLKKKKKEVSPYNVAFRKSKAEYEKIHKEYEGLNQQITQINNELDKMISTQNNENQNMDIDLNQVNIPYSSIYVIEKKLEQKIIRLDNIKKKLKELFNTTEKRKIQDQLKEKIEKIKAKEDKLQDDNEIYRNTVKNHCENKQFLCKLISLCKSITEIMNIFLQEISIEVCFKAVFNNDKPEEINVNIFIWENGKEINYSDGLNRVGRSLFSLSFILSVYIINEFYFVPISVPDLPHSVITRKTFTKAVNIIKEKFSNLQEIVEDKDKYRIVFFMDEIYDGISPVHIIE